MPAPGNLTLEPKKIYTIPADLKGEKADLEFVATIATGGRVKFLSAV